MDTSLALYQNFAETEFIYCGTVTPSTKPFSARTWEKKVVKVSFLDTGN